MVLRLWPLLLGVNFSFTGDGDRNGTPVGLSNYLELFGDPVFRIALRNVGLLVLLLPVAVAIPGLLATFIYLRVPGHRFFRSVYFFPAVLSPVIIGAIFNLLLAVDGPLNAVLGVVGLGPVDWLGDPYVAIFTVVGVHIWATFGMALVVFLAGFATLDTTLLDAARADGASTAAGDLARDHPGPVPHHPVRLRHHHDRDADVDVRSALRDDQRRPGRIDLPAGVLHLDPAGTDEPTRTGLGRVDGAVPGDARGRAGADRAASPWPEGRTDARHPDRADGCIAVPMTALAFATIYPLLFTTNVAMKTRRDYILDRFSLSPIVAMGQPRHRVDERRAWPGTSSIHSSSWPAPSHCSCCSARWLVSR